MFTQYTAAALAGLGLIFLSYETRPQEILEVAHRYLERHGVPCLVVVHVESTHDKGHIARCQDDREWVLLWVENEVAFLNPHTQQTYKWQANVFTLHPELYAPPTRYSERPVF